MSSLVIVGGGFAGVWAAMSAAAERRRSGSAGRQLTITLVSRDSWLTIRPRLYEAHLDGLRIPLRTLFAIDEVTVIEGEVTEIDTIRRAVSITSANASRSVSYDRLVLAAGSAMPVPRIPGSDHLYSVDSFAEAERLQQHIRDLSRREARGRDSAIVVGAGFTGIEVATSLIKQLSAVSGGSRRAQVTLVDRARTLAPDLGDVARERVENALRSLGIEWLVNTAVEQVTDAGLRVAGGRWIEAATVVWSGGFVANPLTSGLDAERDAAGRLRVDQHLRVNRLDWVYAAGDVAAAFADVANGKVAPMSCQCAIPMGHVAGHNAAADLLGTATIDFSHHGYVTCLDLGDAGALFMEGWSRDVKLEGFWGKQMKQYINQVLIDPRRLAAAA